MSNSVSSWLLLTNWPTTPRADKHGEESALHKKGAYEWKSIFANKVLIKWSDSESKRIKNTSDKTNRSMQSEEMAEKTKSNTKALLLERKRWWVNLKSQVKKLRNLDVVNDANDAVSLLISKWTSNQSAFLLPSMFFTLPSDDYHRSPSNAATTAAEAT